MGIEEFSDQFDVMYSVQTDSADTIDEYQKSVWLSMAQTQLTQERLETLAGQPVTMSIDGTPINQVMLAGLVRILNLTPVVPTISQYPSSNVYEADIKLYEELDDHSQKLVNILALIHEQVNLPSLYEVNTLQVVPVSREDLMRLMSKPYPEPLKRQAWRMLVNGGVDENGDTFNKALLILHEGEVPASYTVQCVIKPKPIILVDLKDTGLSIDGYTAPRGCDLDPSLHHMVLERAVSLAKISANNLTQEQIKAQKQQQQQAERERKKQEKEGNQ